MRQLATSAQNSMPSDAQQFHQDLARLAEQGTDPGRIAERAVATWRNLDAALSPIIGQGGVAALFRRSVAMTRAAHPWLATMQEGPEHPGDFAALQVAMSQQTGLEAVAANS